MFKQLSEINTEIASITEGKSVANIQKVEALKNNQEGLHSFLTDLSAYWLLLKLVLKFAKIFTKAKGDATIDKIIAWGDENLK